MRVGRRNEGALLSIMAKRKRERSVWSHRQREREKTGRKISGLSNGNKIGTHIKLSLVLNLL